MTYQQKMATLISNNNKIFKEIFIYYLRIKLRSFPKLDHSPEAKKALKYRS